MAMLINRLKKGINGFLRRRGYRLERVVDYRPHRLEAFELAVRALDVRHPQFFFVQIGANDGRRGDPVFQFIRQYRWRGLLLEPQPDVFRVLVRNYEDEP